MRVVRAAGLQSSAPDADVRGVWEVTGARPGISDADSVVSGGMDPRYAPGGWR